MIQINDKQKDGQTKKLSKQRQKTQTIIQTKIQYDKKTERQQSKDKKDKPHLVIYINEQKTNRQTKRQTTTKEGQKYKQTDKDNRNTKKANKNTNKQKDRQTNRQTNKKTDRQIDRFLDKR